MLTFVSQPAALASAYSPILYQIVATGGDIERLLVQMHRVGVGLIAEGYSDYRDRSGNLPTYTYNFEVDVSGALRGHIDPHIGEVSSVFPGQLETVRYGEKAQIEVVVKFFIMRRNPTTNLIETEVTSTDGDPVTAMLTITDVDEVFFDTFVQSNSLTDGAYIEHELSLPNALFHSFLCSSQITQICYRSYNKTGAMRQGSAPLALTDIPGNNNKKVVTAQIGPVMLAQHGPWVGQPPLIDDDTVRYEVGFGTNFNGVFGGSFRTQTVSVYIRPECPADVRLHWLNKRGGVDSYTFGGMKTKTVDAAARTAKLPLRPPLNPMVAGVMKIETTRQDGWELETRLMDAKTAEWLSGLLNSVEVYMEINDGLVWLVPVIVETRRFGYGNPNDAGDIMQLFVYRANRRRAHSI